MTSRFRTAPLPLALALLFVSNWALVVSSTSAVAQQRRAANFDWEIIPQEDTPTINFTSAALNSEVIFAYDIPTLSKNKTYSVFVYQNDCTTLAANDTSLFVQANATVNGTLVVSLNVNQTSVTESPYWSEINQTTALLSFCIRVDLYLYNESINFHETNVSIAIDMTAGSDLTAWRPVSTDEQLRSDSKAGYPLITYYCDDKNQAVFLEDIFLTDGGTLQFCVEIDPSLEEMMYVRGVLRTSLFQKAFEGTESEQADIVTDSTPDPFTTIRCSSGICNIIHELSSQWFTEGNLNDVVTSGLALISFGSPSVFTDDGRDTTATRRYLSLDPDLVPLYGYDGPNVTVVNRTADLAPNTTTVTGTFTFRTAIVPGESTSSGPTAFQEGVKIAAYVAAGIAAAAIAALVAAKVFATSALASGLAGTADMASPDDLVCGGDSTDSQEDEEEAHNEEENNDGENDEDAVGDEVDASEGDEDCGEEDENEDANEVDDEEAQEETNAEGNGQDEASVPVEESAQTEENVEEGHDVQADDKVEAEDNVQADDEVEDEADEDAEAETPEDAENEAEENGEDEADEDADEDEADEADEDGEDEADEGAEDEADQYFEDDENDQNEQDIDAEGDVNTAEESVPNDAGIKGAELV